MKRISIFLGFATAVAILILLKIFVFSGKKEKLSPVNTNPVIPVECYIAKDTSVNYQLETVGTLRANEQVEIVSEINRKIIAILMKEGAFVTANQLLFKLDDADINARINKLAIEVKLAGANESREKSLLNKGGISQERFDEVSNLRQTLQAEIEILKVDLAKTSIRAPFAGKIGLRNVSEGALVNPGIVLASLQDISKMKLDFSIPERYSRDLHIGSRVSFRTDYLSDDEIAVVEAIEPAVDVATRTLLIRAIAPNENNILVAGTSARVNLILNELEKSIFVPTAALIPSIKGYTVFLKRNGVAQAVMVKTGVRNREYIQIIEGIKVGDTLVITNLLRVKKDSPLRMVKIN
ncbi:MAG: efflux RND transporter periplasmic adaptor subunit [Bacteroidetes bacterium]|nr:efflux RND transporter periplasmic adaptor subunit [Bacteroidota bacterium]